MRLTEQDEIKLSAALDVTMNIVSADCADARALGYQWFIPDPATVRSECKRITLRMIAKTGEPK